MKKMFCKIGILFTLILSFLFSFFSSSSVSDSSNYETIETNVDIAETLREENKIYFTLKDDLEVKSITYEYTTYVEDVLFGRLIKGTTDFDKINDYKYSFDVADDVEGVKIHLVEWLHDEIGYIDDRTTGNNYVGNVNADLREHYVFISADLYTKENYNSYADGLGLKGMYTVTNRLYFNFEDLDVDSVTEVDVKYKQYTHVVEPKYLFWSKSYNTEVIDKTYTASIYNNEDYDFWKTLLISISGGVGMTNEYIEIGKSDRDGYQWFVSLPDTSYQKITYNNYRKDVISSVQIFEISYIDDGVFYEDVDVVQDPTEFVKYEEGDNVPLWLEILLAILNWLLEYYWIILLIIVVLIVIALMNFILRVFRFDKNSREIRKLKKQLKKQRKVDKVERLQSQLNNNYISSSKPKNKKVIRYVKNGKH